MSVLVVLVPFLMFYCYRTGRGTGPGGLARNTFEWLKFRLAPDTTPRLLPEIVGGCEEFGKLPLNPAVDAEELKTVGTAMITDGRMQKPTNVQRYLIDPVFVTRNSVLLHAHMNRKPLESVTLRAAQEALLRKTDAVNSLLLELAIARTSAHPSQRIPPHLEAAFAVLEFSQMVRGRRRGAGQRQNWGEL
jgi:hypothetical protein